jgi:murein tripeptide amidase MpaA
VLGATLDGQDLDLLRIGTPGEGKRICWIVGRQHPGETMAEWWMEGFLHRLLDGDDALSRALLKRAVFNVVPNMNPDGSRRGNLRTNAAGANLNREWQAPTMERSPEVFLVRRAMEASGVDYCLDVHGDEARPCNFLISTAGIPSFDERLKTLYLAHGEALRRANPDFQTALHGNIEAKPGTATMTMCGNWVAETFGCLATTLEMPFKDTVETPDERHGWSPARSRKLGAAGLDAILAVVETLR